MKEMFPPLILIAGNRFEAGKTTIANHLTKSFGYWKCSFAAALKSEVQEALFHADRDRNFKSDIWKDVPQIVLDALGACVDAGDLNCFKKPTSPLQRNLQQVYGTDYRRNLTGENYWVDRAIERASSVQVPLVVFDDARFSNEWDLPGAERWYVYRPWPDEKRPKRQHASEGALDYAYRDFHIMNIGSLDGLFSQIDEYMKKFRQAAA